MPINRRALKLAAKGKLKGCRPSPMRVTLLFLLLTAGISVLLQMITINPIQLIGAALQATAAGHDYAEVMAAVVQAQEMRSALSYPLDILVMLFTWVVGFGYVSYTLDRTRGIEGGYNSLISVFNQSGRVLVMNLIVVAFSFCWYLMLLLPLSVIVTVATIGVLMPVIRKLDIAPDGSFDPSALQFQDSQVVTFLVLILVLMLVLSLVMMIITARYALTSYILLDDRSVGGLDAVRRSRILMRGRAAQYVKLTISFWGWDILLILIGVAVFTGVWLLAVTIIISSGVDIIGGIWMTVGIAAALGASLLAMLPLRLWLTAYREGVLAEYYCAVAEQHAATLPNQGIPAPSGPDLF